MSSIPLRDRGVRRMEDPVVAPLRHTRNGYSQESIGRFSEHSIHSAYRLEGESHEGCQDCLTRIPYASLIATIMCCVGVGVFCGTMYRGATLSALMFEQVFHLHLRWLEPVQLVFVIIGAVMGALGLMNLFVGCLATGATRHKVYRTWRGRVGGRVSCAVFMGITYTLQFIWLLMLCFLIVVTLVFTTFWNLCSSHRVAVEHQCINFDLFDFVFPNNTPPEDMKVCDNELKLFCKDYVERAEVMFILATVACLFVILSLMHYLMCLSANYAHIRDHEKFQELQDLQYLPDMTGMSTTSKDFRER
ncbi:neuronal membrane glycoprotein M6-a [Thrips palmi]|uniref:Neuronal membrane glycoprotein M6-a n=1 Tax=Thrips palmi TaxID=161013 RepID=A0A6P8Z8G6_THRPL|nr:neuronal membrane glycoprotein M6-a [Thrips palmi]XP_034246582.1 neuronal membrane glycoprotein M6-a [Thrips palmi]XP_034246583.1 neuronal membrane glycoprotein M6-a [Thrips palmi]